MNLKYFYDKYGNHNVNLALECKSIEELESLSKKLGINIDKNDIDKISEHISNKTDSHVLDWDELEAVSGGKSKAKEVSREVYQNSYNEEFFDFN